MTDENEREINRTIANSHRATDGLCRSMTGALEATRNTAAQLSEQIAIVSAVPDIVLRTRMLGPCDRYIAGLEAYAAELATIAADLRARLPPQEN